MITFDPIKYINDRLKHLGLVAIIIGSVFIILGVSIIFLPQIIQYLFVIGFVLIGLILFLAALRLLHIADTLSRFELFSGKRIIKE